MALAKGTTKGRATRDTIVAAAAGLLVDEGLEAVTHRAVAARAGVAVGSTTYHFADLSELQRAAADQIADRDIARITAGVAALADPERNPATAAGLIIDLVVPTGDHELLTWYERYARAAREPVLAGAARRTNHVAVDAVGAVLTASGISTNAHAPLVLATVDGAVLGSLADGATPESARSRAAALVETLLRQLD